MLAHTWYALLAIADLSNVLGATVPPSAVKAPAASTSPTPRTDAAVVITSVDGALARFLRTPDGAVDGVVLANGAVARFAPLHCLPFRQGEAIHIRGVAVAGLAGPYLIHASLSARRSGVEAAVSPTPPAPPCTAESGGHSGSAEDHSARLAAPPAVALPADAPRRSAKPAPADMVSAESARARDKKRNRFAKAAQQLKSITSSPSPERTPSAWRRRHEDAGP